MSIPYYRPLIDGSIVSGCLRRRVASRSPIGSCARATSDDSICMRMASSARTVVRSALLVVVIVGVSGCGTSPITSARIERALAPTFANLVHLQLSRVGLPSVAASGHQRQGELPETCSGERTARVLASGSALSCGMGRTVRRCATRTDSVRRHGRLLYGDDRKHRSEPWRTHHRRARRRQHAKSAVHVRRLLRHHASGR